MDLGHQRNDYNGVLMNTLLKPLQKAQKDPIGLFAALHLRQLLVARFYSAAGRKMIKEDLVNQASEIVATLTDLLVSLDDHHLLRAATVLDSIDCFRQESRLESRTRLLEYFDKKNAAEIVQFLEVILLIILMSGWIGSLHRCGGAVCSHDLCRAVQL